MVVLQDALRATQAEAAAHKGACAQAESKLREAGARQDALEEQLRQQQQQGQFLEKVWSSC